MGGLTILGIALYVTHLKTFGWYLILFSSICGILTILVAGVVFNSREFLTGALLWPIIASSILWLGKPSHPIGTLLLPVALVITLFASAVYQITYILQRKKLSKNN